MSLSTTSPAADDERRFDSVTQSRIPAAGAAPVQTKAPNSVFALGASASGASTGQIDHEEVLALEAIAKGACSNAQLRELLAASEATVKRLMQRLRSDGKVELRGFGRSARWGLAKQDGLGWKPAANKKAPKKSAAPPPVAKRAHPNRPAKTPTQALAPATNPPGIVCGLYSSGEVSIEVDGDGHLRLKPEQARYLISWLMKVDAALRP